MDNHLAQFLCLRLKRFPLMAKKIRTKPATKAKTMTHPLQRFLGCYMRLERVRQRRSPTELASAMGLSPGYIKLMEAGAVPINIALADVFIRQMAARGDEAVRDQRIIHFDRLTRYLAGSHWMAAQLVAKEGTIDPKPTVLRAMEDLKDQDPDFEPLYELVVQHVELGSEESEKEFLEKTAVKAVDAFLRPVAPTGSKVNVDGANNLIELLRTIEPAFDRSLPQNERDRALDEVVIPALHNYLKAGPRTVVQTKLDKLLMPLFQIPSLNLDLLRSFVDSVRNRPLLHIGRYAEEWERDNAHRFVSGVCLYSSSDGIIAPLNLERFQFPYLAEERFKELRFLFAKDHTGKGCEHLEQKFFELIEPYSKIRFTREQQAKVKIRIIPEGEYAELTNSLWAGIAVPPEITTTNKEELRKGYWSFEMEEELQIGFTSRKNMAYHDVLNLSFEESLLRHDRFDELWDNVKA